MKPKQTSSPAATFSHPKTNWLSSSLSLHQKVVASYLKVSLVNNQPVESPKTERNQVFFLEEQDRKLNWTKDCHSPNDHTQHCPPRISHPSTLSSFFHVCTLLSSQYPLHYVNDGDCFLYHYQFHAHIFCLWRRENICLWQENYLTWWNPEIHHAQDDVCEKAEGKYRSQADSFLQRYLP